MFYNMNKKFPLEYLCNIVLHVYNEQPTVRLEMVEIVLRQ